jgi:hypothetical protein
MLMLYQIYGLVIASDDLLPRMPFAANTEADVQVRYASLLKPCLSPSDWFMKWYLPSGELWLSFAKMYGGYLLRFNELTDFFVRDCGREILCMSKPETPTETIRHLLLDQVIPMVINLRGNEALHASAVLTSQGLIAFIGSTGSGKSTLAGSFLNAGDSLLSDDCLPLVENNQGIYSIPAYPGLRLWGDALEYLFGDNGGHKSVAHYTDKRRVEIEKITGAFCAEPQPLKRLYTIAEPSDSKGKADIVIERLSPRESFMTLVRSAFRLDITDRDMLKRQFRFFERIASRISVRRLIFPRDFSLLPAVREAILTDLQNLDN